jgi:hypothetical protein
MNSAVRADALRSLFYRSTREGRDHDSLCGPEMIIALQTLFRWRPQIVHEPSFASANFCRC